MLVKYSPDIDHLEILLSESVRCFIREMHKKTQKEFSTVINVSEGTYKSIERAEHNITFDTLDVIYNQSKDEMILHQIF